MVVVVMLGLGGSQKSEGGRCTDRQTDTQTNNVVYLSTYLRSVADLVGKIRKVWPWPGVSGSRSGFCVGGGKAGPEGPTVSVCLRVGWVYAS